MKRLRLQYGTDGNELATDASDVTVVEPRFVAGLSDEATAFREAVRRPIGARPLRELVATADRVAVVIPDITRPMPTDRLSPWLFASSRTCRPGTWSSSTARAPTGRTRRGRSSAWSGEPWPPRTASQITRRRTRPS
jgi:Lactate racemase N-terminal domain